MARSCTEAMKAAQAAPPEQVSATVDWDKVLTVSKTAPTLQVVVNPPLRRGSQIHDPVFQALHNLGADFVRYVPWLPYTRGWVSRSSSLPRTGRPPGISRCEVASPNATLLDSDFAHRIKFSERQGWAIWTDEAITAVLSPFPYVWMQPWNASLRAT